MYLTDYLTSVSAGSVAVLAYQTSTASPEGDRTLPLILTATLRQAFGPRLLCI